MDKAMEIGAKIILSVWIISMVIYVLTLCTW